MNVWEILELIVAWGFSQVLSSYVYAPHWSDIHGSVNYVLQWFVVIEHLDVLKKDNAGAREAIRWLEAEFRKGNR